MNILLTGSSGFVGESLLQRIHKYHQIQKTTAIFRQPEQISHAHKSNIFPEIIPSLEQLAQSQELLSQVDCIIHLAARVHQMHDSVTDPLAAFRAVNTKATEELALAASKAGVKRFIFLSSIKVNGEENSKDTIYQETSIASPQDPYGISKWEAEEKLRHVSNQTGLEVVILRPPLVYGPKVKANFLKMIEIIHKGIPLPLASVNNLRSLVFVENLTDAIINAAIHPAAASQTFLISDGYDISTSDLIKQIATSLQKTPKLLPFPPKLLKLAGQLTGKSDTLDRLTGSLVVDSSKIRQTLNWTPPYTFEQGIQQTCDWYLQSRYN